MQPGTYYVSIIKGLISPFFSEDSLWGNLLIGQYGVLTMTPVYLFGLLLPLVVGFYFFQHVLDDSCLFPRIAKFLDKPFHLLGLNGNAIMPFALGFGCVYCRFGVHLDSRHKKGASHRIRSALYLGTLFRTGCNNYILCISA